jgi:hypothetical protein
MLPARTPKHRFGLGERISAKSAAHADHSLSSEVFNNGKSNFGFLLFSLHRISPINRTGSNSSPHPLLHVGTPAKSSDLHRNLRKDLAHDCEEVSQDVRGISKGNSSHAAFQVREMAPSGTNRCPTDLLRSDSVNHCPADK